MVELGTASSDADFEDVYQFWYDIYVSEMGRHLHDANTSHQYRRLFDPLATAGSLCIARQEGRVVRLAFATYDWGLHVGIKHNYIDCNDHLLKLFTRLGYAEHLPTLYLKEYGRVNSLRLNITDEQPPFLSVLRRFQRQQGLIPSPRTEHQSVPESIVEAFDNYHPRPLRSRPVRTPISQAS